MSADEQVYTGPFKIGELLKCIRVFDEDPHYDPRFTLGSTYDVREERNPVAGFPPRLVVKDDRGDGVYINHFEVWPHFVLECAVPATKKQLVMEAFGFKSEQELEEFLK